MTPWFIDPWRNWKNIVRTRARSVQRNLSNHARMPSAPVALRVCRLWISLFTPASEIFIQFIARCVLDPWILMLFTVSLKLNTEENCFFRIVVLDVFSAYVCLLLLMLLSLHDSRFCCWWIPRIALDWMYSMMKLCSLY